MSVIGEDMIAGVSGTVDGEGNEVKSIGMPWQGDR
jgi:hypothetical protein